MKILKRNMKIKRQTKCKFMDKCPGCVSQFSCLSATAITSPDRRYLLKVCGNRQRANKAMLFGTAKHEEILSKFPTLAEYGYKNFKVDIYKGKVVELQEASFCSALYGLHGIIDYFSIQFIKPNTFKVNIVDVKPRFVGHYIKQAVVYGMMLSDKTCRIGYNTITPRSKRRKRITHRMFPDMDLDLNIDLSLTYYMFGKDTKIKFMENGVLTPQAQGIITAVNRNKYDKIQMHKHGLYYAEYLPPCKNCKRNSEYCSLWDICQKFDYEEEIKNKQRYFGKKQMLVKTKPKMVRRW